MLIIISVKFQVQMYDETLGERVGGERILDFWIDASDLAKVKNPVEVTSRMQPADYKFDMVGMRTRTNERFRLIGCWSATPGELVADKMIPVTESET